MLTCFAVWRFNMKKTISVGLMLLIFAAIINGCAPGRTTEEVVGKPARNYSLAAVNPPVLKNKTVTLDDFKDKIIIINFWATWCPPCKKEIPDFINLYDKYHKDGVVVIGISLDEEGPEIVKPFIEEYKINYPILIGNAQVAKDYGGITGIPTSFVLDRSGKIYKKYIGYRPVTVFLDDLKSLGIQVER